MLFSIQYLRGFAALAVVLFHLYAVFFLASKNPLEPGAAGVDVFFVISGFIMWHIAQKREPTPADFLRHRFIRIAPLYWVITLILAACAIVKPNLFPLDNPTASDVALSLAFIPHETANHNLPIISQGWTLNYEVFFYLVFASSLLLPRAARIPIITISFGALTIAGFLFAPDNLYLAWVTKDVLMEFVMGMLIAAALERRWLLARPIAMIGVALSVVLIGVGGEQTSVRALVWGIPAAIIVWSMVSIEEQKPFRGQPILTLLGNASYSIYLVHFLAASTVNILAPHLGMPTKGIVPYGLAVVIALAAGVVCYRFVEQPLLFALRRLIEQGQVRRDTAPT